MALQPYEEYLKDAKDIHGDKYIYPSKEVYESKDLKIPLVCAIHGTFHKNRREHIRLKAGCAKCAIKQRKGKKKITREQVIERSNKIHNNKYNYDKMVLGATTKVHVTITCPIHGDFQQAPYKHMDNRGCPKCAGKHSYNYEEWRELAKSIRGDKYSYDNAYYVNKTTKVNITCKLHGDFSQLPGDHLYKKVGCGLCNASTGEKKVITILEKHNIPYEFQYSLPDSRYEFDFKIPGINILIEYNGKQHYEFTPHFHSRPGYGFDYQQELDHQKRLLIDSTDLNLIVIRYDVVDMEDFLLKEISKYYKYRVNNKWYKTYLAYLKGEKLLNPDGSENLVDPEVRKNASKYLVHK